MGRHEREGVPAVARWAGAVVGMAALALGVAYVTFGWPVLVIGGPVFVGVVTTLVVLLVTERPRRAFVDRRDGRTAHTPWQTAAERGDRAAGLMSGFFEISPQVSVPPIGEYRIPAQGEPAGVAPDPAGPDDVRHPWPSRSARPAGV